MVFSFLFILLVFWLIRDIKYILFWIYLWQLKQYHFGRFVAHFKTDQGRKLILNPIQALKIILILSWILFVAFSLDSASLLLMPALFLIYFIEAVLYFRAMFSKRAKYPKPTRKIAFLFLINLFITVNFPFVISPLIKTVFWFGFALLVFDVLIPVMVSAIVLLCQPLADYYRLSLQKKAKMKIGNLNAKLKIIAVVGSYGKTSTKEYLNTILSSKYRVLSTNEHRNTEVGIPLAILNDLKPEHEIFIVEMGAYDKGTIKRICDFVKPNIGIVTGINEQHLSLFGSMDNLLSAEGGRELLQSLPNNGLLVVNGENSYCLDLYNKANIKKIAYNLNQVANINITKNNASFDIKEINFTANILGRHNSLNLLGAITVAMEIGMTLEEISKAVRSIGEEQIAYKITRNEKGINIIDSTYSSNPDGVIADLEFLKIYHGKKIIVMPCLIELGSAAKEVHQKIGGKIAEICDLAIITTAEYYQEIKNQAVKSGMGNENIILIEKTNLIIKKINSFSEYGDTVLLEGRLQVGVLAELKK